MKLAIMQPYLFPYIGYYQLIGAVDRFVVSDDVTYIKQGWINRNRLLINGEAAYFTVPLRQASASTLIKDMTVDGGAGWRHRLLKTIANFYRRAPQFALVFPLVETVLNPQALRIADLAVASLMVVADYLHVRPHWIDSSANYRADLRGEDRVLSICKAEGATEYINPPGGQKLYSRARFEGEGVRLRFLQPHFIEYKQFNNPFVPWLSIVDVLMFNSRDVVRSYLDRYDLK